MHALRHVLCVILMAIMVGMAPVSTSTAYGQTGSQPLIAAILSNDVETIQALLDSGSALNGFDRYQRTPLMYATYQGNISVMELLLVQGANPNLAGPNGVTPLMIAYNKQHIPAASLLLRYGAVRAGFPQRQWSHLLRDVRRYELQRLRTQPVAMPEGTGTAGWVKPVLIGGAVLAGVGGAAYAYTVLNDDDSPSAPPAAPAENNEYTGQYAIQNIQAQTAHERGYTGSGVTVAVIDSGVDLSHPDLVNNIVSGGIDVFDNDSNPNPEGQGPARSHGTAVAGIIAASVNGSGIVGVAPDAGILAIRAGDSSGAVGNGTDIIVPSALNAAVESGARVINNSWGASIAIDDPLVDRDLIAQLIPNQLEAHANAVDNDIITVFAAGNEGIPEVSLTAGIPVYFPEFEPLWLAVVSVDSSNTISSFSNRCGIAQAFCLAAPGEAVITTAASNDVLDEDRDRYIPLDGTSFAAPHVAGAAAVLLQAFPNLTPEEVVQILLTTADDLGESGVDDVYGHGLINLERATQPIGDVTIATGGSVDSALASVRETILSAGPALHGIIDQRTVRLQVLDDYKRPYSLSLGALTHMQGVRQDHFTRLRHFHHPDRHTIQQISPDLHISLTDHYLPPEVTPEADENHWTKAMTVHQHLGDSHTILKFNQPASESFSFARALGYTAPSLQRDAHGSGALSVARLAQSIHHHWHPLERLQLHVGSFHSMPYNSTIADYHSLEAHGMVGHGLYQLSEQALVGIQFGMMREADSVLGSSGSGAFALGGSQSWFASLGARYSLSATTHLFGHYGQTITEQEEANGLLAFSSLRSEHFMLGLTSEQVLGHDDRLAVSISQPMHTVSGHASLTLPTGRDLGGQVFYDQLAINLAERERPVDVEAYYALPFSHRTALHTGGLLRFNAPTAETETAEGLFVLRLNHVF